MVLINNCEFYENIAHQNGGAILNWGEVNCHDSKFAKNIAHQNGGAINNQIDGQMNFDKCIFDENSANHGGGAIINFTQMTLTDSKFIQNTSDMGAGGVISNQPNANLKTDACSFINNRAKIAGVIENWGKVAFCESEFANNSARGTDGVILNMSGSVLSADNCSFKANIADKGTCISNDGDDAKFIDCLFSNHGGLKNMIFNEAKLDVLGGVFKDNENVDCIIFSENNSRLSLSGGKIHDNTVKKSVIHTKAEECIVSRAVFNNNGPCGDNVEGIDIFNEANLSIQSPKFSCKDAVVNQGHIDVKQLSRSDLERFIKNVGEASVDVFDIPEEYGFDFSHIDDLIQNNDGCIVLKEDISIENYELDFYEGGIDLDKDHLIIDGDNHIIDGRNRTRIFNVIGRNITLKNIIFKNGLLRSPYDEQVGGGGAIKVTENCSLTLENCQFIGNRSQDDGGAILNNGTLQSINNKFADNVCDYNGGAICNNNVAHVENNAFENNASKIAGAIYNNHKLTIKNDILLDNNSSDFKGDIYNADSVKTENTHFDMQKVYNTHNINVDENIEDWRTLDYLNEKLEGSSAILDRNIIINYEDIDDDSIPLENIEFDGNNHIIDFNGRNINFKIGNGVLIRNLTFKNAVISENSLFEIEGNVQFENVKFLNNKITTDCCLFSNNGELKFIDSSFFNNGTKIMP